MIFHARWDRPKPFPNPRLVVSFLVLPHSLCAYGVRYTHVPTEQSWRDPGSALASSITRLACVSRTGTSSSEQQNFAHAADRPRPGSRPRTCLAQSSPSPSTPSFGINPFARPLFVQAPAMPSGRHKTSTSANPLLHAPSSQGSLFYQVIKSCGG